MGGSAFAAAPHFLRTPRMPPEVYRHMVTQCHAALATLFRTVTTPVEAPAKADFGDVDFLVAGPLILGTDKSESTYEQKRPNSGDRPLIWQRIEQELGAARIKYNSKDATANLALPWPRAFSTGPESRAVHHIPAQDQQLEPGQGTLEYKHGETAPGIPDTGATEEAKEATDHHEQHQQQPNYVQVDIRICQTAEQLLWAAFKHAHGDMWQLLGTIIRPLGLKADETGLYLVVPEIEPLNKKRAMVLLSDDPGQVCEFLGLPYADGQWDKPFDSVDDMFNYAAGCRFFWVWPSSTTADDNLDPPPTTATTEAAAIKSNTNDRRRHRTRPVFRAWVDDFIPHCRAQGLHRPPTQLADLTQDQLRDHVRAEAFSRFQASRALYASQLAVWTAERQELAVRTELIKAVASEDVVQAHPSYDPVHGCSRSVVIAALRSIVVDGDVSYGGIAPAEPLRNPDGSWRIDEAAAWLTANWASVADVAWAMNRAKSSEHMRAKRERVAAAEGEFAKGEMVSG